MLNRHVQIMTYFRFFLHYLNQFVCDFLRITIQNSNPNQPVNFTKSSKQLRQFLFPIQVTTIDSCFLRNQNQFLHAFFYESHCLFFNALHRNTSIITTYFRNDTIGASLITALSNLKVGKMSTGCQKSILVIYRF